VAPAKDACDRALTTCSKPHDTQILALKVPFEARGNAEFGDGLYAGTYVGGCTFAPALRGSGL
jgi:hypothetical protein